MTTTFYPGNRRADALSDGQLGRAGIAALPMSPGIHVLQQDSRLRNAELGGVNQARSCRTADLYTGSGVVGIAAATLAASPVTAWGIALTMPRHFTASVWVNLRAGRGRGVPRRRPRDVRSRATWCSRFD